MASFVPRVPSGLSAHDEQERVDKQYWTAPHRAIQRKIMRVPTIAQLQSDPQSVADQERLIILLNPPLSHRIWENTLASYETAGSLHFEDASGSGVTLPPIMQADNSTFEVRVSIRGRKLNPSVRADIFISRGQQGRIYTAHIDWPFQPIKHHSGSLNSGINMLKARIDEFHEYLELTFTPQCAVSINLLPVAYDQSLLHLVDDITLSTSELIMLRDLADIVEHPNDRQLSVRFKIGLQERNLLAAGDIQTAHGKLLEDLPSLGNHHPHPDFITPRWRFYRKDVGKLFSDESSSDKWSNSGDANTSDELALASLGSSDSETYVPAPIPEPLQVMFDDMKSRRAVLSRPHPGTPVKHTMVFADQEDALITLAYGAYLEHEEQNATFEAVRRDAHEVRLCSVDSRVLALVNFSSPPTTGLPHDRFRLDDRTKVELRIGEGCMNADDGRSAYAAGLVVANVFNLPRCDLLILITDKNARALKLLAQPIDVFQAGDETKLTKSKVHVSPQLFKMPYKMEVDAVTRAYGPGCATEHLPFLLGDGSRLEPTTPVNPAISSNVRSRLSELRTAKPWNKQQLKVIDSVHQPAGGAIIVTGPGGTGKTELIVHLVQFGVRCGQYIMIAGTRNDTLDDMTLKIDRMDPTLQPIRFYAPSQEHLGVLFERTANSVNPFSKNQSLVNRFDAIEADTVKTRRALPQFSVLGRVIQNLERSKPLHRRFRSVSKSQPIIDVRAYFRDRLPLLRANLFHAKGTWINGEVEKSNLLQAYKFLRQEVMGEARVILSTNCISGNVDIVYGFALKSKVWVFWDEAQSMTESSLLIPFGLHTPAEEEGEITREIVLMFLSGDLKQLPPFTCSRNGQYCTVNEFHEQRSVSLIERKIRSGFPAVALEEQRRAAEILMRGANMFHYSGKLVTPFYPDLDPKLRNLLPSLAGFHLAASDSIEKSRLAWLEIDSPVYENKYTGSRANPMNAAVVRRCLIRVREVYGKTTNAKVMLATPYKRQKELYLSMACELKDTLGFTDKELPRICTIDSLIGREASFVILDLVNNGTEGFLRDIRRSCVAFTRAKDMFLVIGGKFKLPTQDKLIQPKDLKDPVTSTVIPADMSRPLTFYHAFFKANGFLHPMNTATLPRTKIPSDLQPLGTDQEDQQIENDFTEVEEFLRQQDELEVGWEFVPPHAASPAGKVVGSVDALAATLKDTSL